MTGNKIKVECPYCLEPIYSTDAATVCPTCGTLHHRDCWQENRGCCVRTCGQVSRMIEVEADSGSAERIEISAAEAEAARPMAPGRRRNPCIKCGRQAPEGEIYCSLCTVEPEEHPDARNAGPILVMVGILAVLLAWIIVALIIPGLGVDDAPLPPPQPGVQSGK